MRGHYQRSEEQKARHTEANVQSWKDPEIRKRRIDGMKSTQRAAPLREALLAAEQNGEQFIFTGKPCRNSHIAKRRVKGGGACLDCERDYALRKLYGITLEQYQELLAKQDGRCAICKRDRPLSVDHCHTTGRIRGLLCSSCNIVVGHIENDRMMEGVRDYFHEYSIPCQEEVLDLE